MAYEQRAEGCLLGLACGDALGRPVEFKSASRIEREHGRVTDMLGHGTHGKPGGTVTDDTDLALCIAESLVARGGFDPDDVAERFVDWLESGPFDVGRMTRDAIAELRNGVPATEAGQRVWEASQEGANAGNGSVMRCAPYALAYADQPAELERVSRASSAITHADPRCTWGCVLLNRTLAGLIRGDPDPLGAALDGAGEAPDELRQAVSAVYEALHDDGAADSLSLSSSGYVVHTLQTALFDGLSAGSAEGAVVRAVNRGGDTDTIGAVTGAVAGARFGSDALPMRWLDAVDGTDRLRSLSRDLWALAPRDPRD